MKIVVFGGTGKTGHEVLEQALERGYEVVAYARNPEKIGIHHEILTVSKGELHEIAAIKRAISGADGVISLLGATGDLKDNALSEGVKNIISAMEEQGVGRLIQVGTASARDPHDKRDLVLSPTIGLLKRIMPNVYAEIVRISDAMRDSRLNWTLVRVPYLNDKPMTKTLRVGYVGDKKVGTSLSRADLAWFMVEQLKSTEYIKKAPFISN